MKNIVLIGMPGSGKSTMGVLLAKAIGCDFIDTDVLIQVRYGKKLQTLLNEQGLEAFLKLESDTVCAMEAAGAVIATGGSVVYSDAAIRHLRENGVIVYLRLPCDEIIRRVKNLSTRGVALREGQTLDDLYNERVPLYERACDLPFDPCGTMEEAVEALRLLLTEQA